MGAPMRGQAARAWLLEMSLKHDPQPDNTLVMGTKVKRLKEIIDVEQGRRRRWVAEKIGLTPATFRQVMAGYHDLSKERAQKLADLLGVKLSEIWNEK